MAPQPLTPTRALVAFVVLAAGVAAVSFALLSLMADLEQQALVFAAGGGCLALWSAARLTARSRA